MGRRKKEPAHKYGCPVYGIAWPPGDFVYMCGGGGHGIENKLLVVSCAGGQLSEEVAKLNTGKDAGYRMAVHPSGRALVLGMSVGGLERVDLEAPPSSSSSGGAPPVLALAKGEFKQRTAGIGPIKGMSFSGDGRLLALGGEDGAIEVWEWPAMARRARWQASPKPVRNLDFSPAHGDGVLLSCDESGVCKLWGVEGGQEIAQLQAPPDMPRASFFRCKSAFDDQGVVLYTAMKWKRDGWVARWRQDEEGSITLEARSRRPVAPAPICGFELSRSGDLMAAVTPDGDQCVISAATLEPIKYVRGAHMTFATTVAFSPDETLVISGASDASAVLTRLARPGGSSGGALLALLLALLVAVLAALLGALHYASVHHPRELAQLLQPLAPLLRRAGGQLQRLHWVPRPVAEFVLRLTP